MGLLGDNPRRVPNPQLWLSREAVFKSGGATWNLVSVTPGSPPWSPACDQPGAEAPFENTPPSCRVLCWLCPLQSAALASSS